MNKECISFDGKLVVSNENGTMRQIDYTDKTKDILIQENVIETIKDNLKSTETEINKKTDEVKYEKKLLISLCSICILLLIVAWSTYTGSPEVITEPLLKYFMFFVTASCPLFFVLMGNFYKEKVSVLNSFLQKKDYLENSMEQENQKLLELQKSQKAINIPNNFTSERIDDTKEIEKLSKRLEVLNDISYKMKKLKKLQKQGQLLETLKKDYNEEDIKFIELEVTKAQLVKSRGKN